MKTVIIFASVCSNPTYTVACAITNYLGHCILRLPSTKCVTLSPECNHQMF